MSANILRYARAIIRQSRACATVMPGQATNAELDRANEALRKLPQPAYTEAAELWPGHDKATEFFACDASPSAAVVVAADAGVVSAAAEVVCRRLAWEAKYPD
jgi:hypothetical protein